ncbi:MAG: LacI family DNA-binding transcriptional regulator [Candidatus Scatomorpha sp.]|jgi:LacI family transcriptional regulator
MTIKDIARQCGVSVSTVSRVLNDRPDVSPAVRAAVLEAVRSSNYVPNNSARDLVKVTSDAVGLIVRGVSNPFFTDIIKAVEREIDAAGYTMVMQQIDIAEDEIARGAIMEREKKLRGLIFLGGRSDCAPEDMGTITVPFVCCSFTNSFGTLSKSEYSSVSIEDVETAGRAVRELHRLGHRRIAALVSKTDDRSISELRYHGYTRALRECGLEPKPELVACAGSFGMHDAYAATQRLLDSGAEFTAIFAISDMMAIAAIKALEDRGRRVPESCSVIAIDGLELSEYTRPTLTTLCQPSERMGAESVRILMEMIEGRGGNRQILLEPELRPGGSVRAV